MAGKTLAILAQHSRDGRKNWWLKSVHITSSFSPQLLLMLHDASAVPSRAGCQSCSRPSSNRPTPSKADKGERSCVFLFNHVVVSLSHPLPNLIDTPEGWRHVRGTHSGRPNVPCSAHTRGVKEEIHFSILITTVLLPLSFTSQYSLVSHGYTSEVASPCHGRLISETPAMT